MPRRTPLTGKHNGVAAALVTAAIVVAATGCGGGSTKSTAVRPRESTTTVAPVTVPNGELTGAGAFEGPLLKVPVATGIQLAYRRFGAGPPLLLLTGSTTAMTIWTPSLLQALARHFRVTIVDYRGVGASTDDAAPMTVPLLAHDTSAFMEAVGLRARLSSAGRSGARWRWRWR